MRVLVIGAAGMVGRKLVEKLVAGALGTEIESLTLADIVAPPPMAGAETLAADLASPGTAARLIAGRPDLIFHLAAVVSGEAEADYRKGYRVNLDGTRELLDAIRLEGLKEAYAPRLVFTSSIAVFGAPLPEVIPDDQRLTPLTSYGAQKAMCELLISDLTRRGRIDGISIRLPTIVIRPGKPNKAASGFFSSILREPLIGQEAVLPVGEDVRHWFASPRAAVSFLIHAAKIDTAKVPAHRALTMPGLAATVAEEIEALRRVAGDKAVKLIRREPDETVARIIAGWPRAFDTAAAEALGFRAEASFDEIIQAHIEDELGGKLPG